MIKVVIIDDEQSSVELTTNLLKLSGVQTEIIATADSVAAGYETLKNNSPDLVFLDVQMQDGTGFDLLKKFEILPFKVIFITGFQEFAINAFKYSAIDYLMKPVSPLDFMAAVKKAEQAISAEETNLKLQTLLYNLATPPPGKKKIVLKTADRVYALCGEDIIRFESAGSYTTVYLRDGNKIMVSRLIKDFDELLSGTGFFRLHQSHLINMEHLFCFEKHEGHVIMKDQSVVPVSSRKKDQLLTLLQGI